MDYGKLKKNFEDHRFLTSYFETREEAAAYLKENNQVVWHWKDEMTAAEARRAAMDSTVYILSANGVSETGELVNIDGTGNRAAASLFGPERVFYVIGRNKIAPDLHSTIARAKNTACTKNARRLGVKTPCAASEELRCYDCNSPARICSATVILERPCNGMTVELVFINEDLGY